MSQLKIFVNSKEKKKWTVNKFKVCVCGIGDMTCTSDQFRCPNERCINNANVCDGQCDCLTVDGSCADETNCTEFYSKIDGKL